MHLVIELHTAKFHNNKQENMYSHSLPLIEIIILYLFNKVDAWLKVKAKVNEFPFNALLLVLLLLKNKHVMIEELLELLVSEVDAQLLKRVDLYSINEKCF